MIRFTCPNCETKLKAGEDKAGAKITCPECREKVTVPSDDGDQEPVSRSKKGGSASSGSNKAVLIGVAGVACVAVAGIVIAVVMASGQGKATDTGKTAQAAPQRDSTPPPAQVTTPPATVPAPATNPAAKPAPVQIPGIGTTPPVAVAPAAPMIPIPAPGTPGNTAQATKPPEATGEKKPSDQQEASVLTGPLEKDVRQRLLKSTCVIFTVLPKGGLSMGSGSLIDRDNRLVLTNFHVISDEHKGKLRVFFPEYDKGEVVPERSKYIERLLRKGEGIPCHVVHKDLRRDLAVVQLVDLPPGIQTLPIAKKSAEPGERMHSMGNPGASGACFVYTHGNIRAVYQKQWIIPGHGKDDPTLDLNAKVVETQSPINQGDSGGPAVNDRKELIGVNQSKIIALGVSEMNIAIDVTEVKYVLRETYRANPAMKPPKDQATPTEEGRDIPVLVKRLKNSDAVARLQAAEVLGRYGADARAAIPELVKTLKDSDDAVRKAAAESLQQIGSVTLSYLPAMREALKDKSPEVRIAVIGILSLMGADAEEAVPDLMSTMKDPEKLVRHKATLAIGQLGPVAKAAVPDLAKALKDESADVRMAAAAGLAKMQGKALPALKEIGDGLKDDNRDVRVSLLEAVKNLGPEAKDLVPELRKALQVRDKETRLGAVEALGSIGDGAKEAVGDLVDLAEYKELRVAVTDTLVRIGKVAIPELRKKLRHPRKEVRLAAVQVLEKFGSDAKSAVPDLNALFRSPSSDEELRKAIQKALRKIL
jgi:HEAT repeat protein/S1-C subfamily serine protease